MTITRPFLHIGLLALLGALAWAGAAAAEQVPAGAVPAAAASTAKAASPVVKSKPHVQQASARNEQPVRATNTADAAKSRLSERYVPHQHGLIDQYQNAVTPPPIDIGR
jgi:hypothetical protein